MVRETHGKFKVNATTILMPSKREIDAEVYIHLKGYARARVSHVDIEKLGLGKVIRRGRGNILEIRRVENGLEIVLREECHIALDEKDTTVSSIVVTCPLLSEIIGEEKSTKAWVGRKYDGIYVGFAKAQLERLEKLASERFQVKPLTKLEQPRLTTNG